jgi:NADH-quinone oxidoreductase subunit L
MVGAVRLLRTESLVPARLAPPESGLARLLWKKWYVDELYDAVIVRPVMWVSREVLWKIVDVRIVDGLLVNGTAVVTRALGWVGSRLQTGEVGAYVVIFVGGVLAVLFAALR